MAIQTQQIYSSSATGFELVNVYWGELSNSSLNHPIQKQKTSCALTIVVGMKRSRARNLRLNTEGVTEERLRKTFRKKYIFP